MAKKRGGESIEGIKDVDGVVQGINPSFSRFESRRRLEVVWNSILTVFLGSLDPLQLLNDF